MSDEGIITAIIFNIILLIVYILFLSNNIFREHSFIQPNHKIAFPAFFVLFLIMSIVFGFTYMSKRKNAQNEQEKNMVKLYLGLLSIDSLLLLSIITKIIINLRN